MQFENVQRIRIGSIGNPLLIINWSRCWLFLLVCHHAPLIERSVSTVMSFAPADRQIHHELLCTSTCVLNRYLIYFLSDLFVHDLQWPPNQVQVHIYNCELFCVKANHPRSLLSSGANGRLSKSIEASVGRSYYVKGPADRDPDKK